MSDPKPRRPKGDGGFSNHPSGDGRVRGYKNIDGKRIYTKWCVNKQVAAAALKSLTALPSALASSQDALSKRTVGDAVDSFLRYGTHAPRTLVGYQQSSRLYLAELLDMECSEMLPAVIAEHMRALRLRGLGQSTMRQARAVLSGGLKWAVANGWVAQNYASAVSVPDAKAVQVDAVSDEELDALVLSMKGHRYEARFLLAVRLGLRPAEARGLRWRDVDFETGRIFVRGQLQRVDLDVDGTRLGTIYKTSPKSRAGFRNFLAGQYVMGLLAEWQVLQEKERAAHVLTAHQLKQRSDQTARIQRAKDIGLIKQPEMVEPLPDDLVFTQPNTDPLLERLDITLWKQLCDKAFAGKPRLYAARHTAIHVLLMRTGDLLAVSAMAGHIDGNFTRRTYGGPLDKLTDRLHLEFEENQ